MQYYFNQCLGSMNVIIGIATAVAILSCLGAMLTAFIVAIICFYKKGL